MMEKADVVFFRATDTFISKAIASITSSEFTHVGMVTDTNKGNSGIIIEANRFIKTRERAFTFDPSSHALYRLPTLTEKQKEDIVLFAKSMVGTSYDYGQILSLFLRLVLKLNTGTLFDRANAIICSELIDIPYYIHSNNRKSVEGVGNVFPQELLDLYDFKLVNPNSLKKTL
jgi:hypothetical protein